MRRLAILFPLLLLGAEPARVYTVYVPIAQTTSGRAVGVEFYSGFPQYHDGLAEVQPAYLRTHLSNWLDPWGTLYQTYLSGGWAAADAVIEPFLAEAASLGAQPLFIFMYGGLCQAPTVPQLAAYGDFIAAAAQRYHVWRFEVWNEPDASGGLASLHGCFGTQHTSRLTYLVNRVQMQLPETYEVGASFMLQSQEQADMLAAVAPALDWVGFHHYGVWSVDTVLDTWPGSVAAAYAIASASGKPAWLTEVNVRDPSAVCSAEFYTAQADYIDSALSLGLPFVSVLVYSNPPDWQCTGVYQTPADDVLRAYPAP